MTCGDGRRGARSSSVGCVVGGRSFRAGGVRGVVASGAARRAGPGSGPGGGGWGGVRLGARALAVGRAGEDGMVCRSGRTGWDLWLRASGLLEGDEVLM